MKKLIFLTMILLGEFLLASCASTALEVENMKLNGKNWLKLGFTDQNGLPIQNLECEIIVALTSDQEGTIKVKSDQKGQIHIKKIPENMGYGIFIREPELKFSVQVQYTGYGPYYECHAYAINNGKPVLKKETTTDEEGKASLEDISGGEEYCLYFDTVFHVMGLSY